MKVKKNLCMQDISLVIYICLELSLKCWHYASGQHLTQRATNLLEIFLPQWPQPQAGYSLLLDSVSYPHDLSKDILGQCVFYYLPVMPARVTIHFKKTTGFGNFPPRRQESSSDFVARAMGLGFEVSYSYDIQSWCRWVLGLCLCVHPGHLICSFPGLGTTR